MHYRHTSLSRAHGVAASVNGQIDSGDEAGGVGRQEGDALGHFVHVARSTQRVRLLALGQKLRERHRRDLYSHVTVVVKSRLEAWPRVGLPERTAPRPVPLACERL